MKPQRPLRLLYIYPDTMGLRSDPAKNPLHYLSEHFEGDFLAVWWVPDQPTAVERAVEMQDALGRFNFYWTRSYRFPPVLRHLWDICFYVGKGLVLSRRRGGYDAIVTYGPFRTALSGLILRALTGSKLIVEFPGHPYRSFELHGGMLNRLKRIIAPAWSRWIAGRADHLRLLYPGQLDDLEVDFRGRASAFHDFTTVSSIGRASPPAQPDNYLLFVGFPFFLKGVDVLLRAFNQISSDFPDQELRIVGFCSDLRPWKAMAESNPRVRFLGPLPHEAAMDLMAGCSALILPSRTEAMGRVLLEAMALARPVIASAVEGIPYYVRHGQEGLLVPPGDIEALAARMREVLSNQDLRAKLGQAGYKHAHTNLSEIRYADTFREMVEYVTGRAT